MSALTRIDRYRIEAIIGTGGFATVYRAIDERFDTPVAIKVLADNHAVNPEIRERFITEVHLLRRLAGVPAVAVYDLGETDQGQPYAVMALADGDLGDRVARFRAGTRPVGWTEVSRVIDELTRSLDPLHARGIVHRDIKPSNLLVFGQLGNDRPASAGETGLDGHRPGAGELLTGWEALRLGDLGFAKDLVLQSGLTAGGGTPGFMPPEQARPGRVDTRADIYAATAVVVWLVCDRVPTSLRPGELEDHLARTIGSGCSSEGLLAGLANDADRRPPTVGQWRDLLYQTMAPTSLHSTGLAAASEPTRLVTDTSMPPPPATTTSGPTGGRLLRLALVAALCALSAVAAVLLAPSLGIGGDDVEVVRGEDGVRRSRTVDELNVALIGPEQIEVGEAVTFTAEVSGARSVRWIGPDGTVTDGSEPLTVQASRPGDGAVSLLATPVDSGEVVVIEAPFEVVDPQP